MVGNVSQPSSNLITHACEFAEAESDAESVSDSLAKRILPLRTFKIHSTVPTKPFGGRIISDNFISESTVRYVSIGLEVTFIISGS
jgi:hypothetical protein